MQPVLNRITNRASFSWTSAINWNAIWGNTIRLTGATNASRQPIEGNTDETVAILRATQEFRPSPEHHLYFGGRVILRNPHLSLGYDPQPLEYWGFLGYALALDFTPRRDTSESTQ